MPRATGFQKLHLLLHRSVHGRSLRVGSRERFVRCSGRRFDSERGRRQHQQSLATGDRLRLRIFPDVSLHHHLVSLVRIIRVCVRVSALKFTFICLRYGLTIRPQSYMPYGERVSDRYQPYRLGVSNPLFFTNQEYITPISTTLLTPPTTISNLDQWTRTITR